MTARPTANSSAQLFERGLAHHRRGEHHAAEQCYNHVLADMPGNAPTLHLLGLLHQQTGRLDTAEHNIGRAIAIAGQTAVFHLSLGNLYLQQGRLAEAAASYRKVLELDATNLDARYNLGTVHLTESRNDEAILCFEQVARTRQDYPGVHASLAEAFFRTGRFNDAAAAFCLAIEAQPGSASLFNRVGIVLRAQGKLDDAIEAFRSAVHLDRSLTDALNNLGNTLYDRGRLDEAMTCFHGAIALEPDTADFHNNLGNCLKEKGESPKASLAYRRAIALNPRHHAAYFNLANILRSDGHADEAADCFRTAIGIKPDFVDAMVNLGGTLAYQQKLAEAKACYDRALAQQPDMVDTHFNLALALLAMGDLEAGWREYEWRWNLPQMAAISRAYTAPRWHGEAATGRTLLIQAEQGFGDTLQFCRYATMAAERGLRVILCVPTPLTRLARRVAGVEAVCTEGEPLPRHDLQCPMLSLPFAFHTTLETIPTGIPYLSADAPAQERWRARLTHELGSGPRVGLVWAGSSRLDTPSLAAVDRRRSIAPGKLAPIAEIPDLKLISLQKAGPAPPASLPVLDYMREMTDFADTAALVMNLDLVISVDTAVAHLAAALGKPVWLLDRFDSCWRWLTGRTDSPWYPTLRVFRQAQPDVWTDVVNEVAGELRRQFT